MKRIILAILFILYFPFVFSQSSTVKADTYTSKEIYTKEYYSNLNIYKSPSIFTTNFTALPRIYSPLFGNGANGPSDLNSLHSRGFIIPDPHSKGN